MKQVFIGPRAYLIFLSFNLFFKTLWFFALSIEDQTSEEA